MPILYSHHASEHVLRRRSLNRRFLSCALLNRGFGIAAACPENQGQRKQNPKDKATTEKDKRARAKSKKKP